MNQNLGRILGGGAAFIAAIFFLMPLANPTRHAGLFGQDAVAHSRILDLHCREFPYVTPRNVDSLFAPMGVPLAVLADSPSFSALACLTPTADPIARFHVLVGLHWLILWFVLGLWAYRRYQKWLPRALFITALSFGAYIQIRSLGHYNLFPLMWAPFALLLMLEKPVPLKLPMMAFKVALITLIFLSSWQSFPFLALLLAVLVARQFQQSPNRKELFWKSAVSLSVAVGLLAFFMAAIIASRGETVASTPMAQMGYRLFNSEILSYLIPGPLSPWFQDSVVALAGSFPQQQGLYENINSFEIGILILLPFLWLERKALRPQLRFLAPLIAVYFILSLGSEVRFANSILFENPAFTWLHSLPPFSLSRTPGRYATMVIALLTHLVCLGLDHRLKSQRSFFTWEKTLAAAALLLVLFNTGILSTTPRQTFTEDFVSQVPLDGLEKVKQRARLDTFTFQVPLALMGDPTQDFLQIFHQQKLVNGYVSYTLMNEKTLAHINAHPVLAALDCAQPPRLDFARILQSETNLQQATLEIVNSLKQARIQFLIINWPLVNSPGCENLGRFLQRARQLQDQFTLLEEKGRFIVLEIR